MFKYKRRAQRNLKCLNKVKYGDKIKYLKNKYIKPQVSNV